jgi:nitronate monooxygenase
VIMPLATRFTELAGCAVPIQQAPMGSVSTPALAVAVADPGGVAGATAGSTEITGAFSVCPLCATEPRARVLRSCIDALGDLPGDTVGEATVGGERISLPKGHGLPPGATATGHISAMPMYAGESAAAVHAVEPVAEVVKSWCATADEPS